MLWHEISWNGMIWCDMTLHDMICCDMKYHDMTWNGMIWCDMTWNGLAWYDVTWHDMTWHDTTATHNPRSKIMTHLTISSTNPALNSIVQQSHPSTWLLGLFYHWYITLLLYTIDTNIYFKYNTFLFLKKYVIYHSVASSNAPISSTCRHQHQPHLHSLILKGGLNITRKNKKPVGMRTCPKVREWYMTNLTLTISNPNPNPS